MYHEVMTIFVGCEKVLNLVYLWDYLKYAMLTSPSHTYRSTPWVSLPAFLWNEVHMGSSFLSNLSQPRDFFASSMCLEASIEIDASIFKTFITKDIQGKFLKETRA